MKTSLFITTLVLILGISAEGQTVNGRNVKSLRYRAANGTTGSFWMTSGTNWVEQNSAGTKFYFVEYRSRDDWSVYLKDESRNIFLQLDLWRKKVSLLTGPSKSDLYTISNSYLKNNFSNGAPVNGQTVSKVFFNGGSFKAQGNKWTEEDAYGKVKFTFNQQARDEWSVYLFDPSRNVKIQLDLHRKKIVYSQGNGPKSDLYTITGYK